MCACASDDDVPFVRLAVLRCLIEFSDPTLLRATLSYLLHFLSDSALPRMRKRVLGLLPQIGVVAGEAAAHIAVRFLFSRVVLLVLNEMSRHAWPVPTPTSIAELSLLFRC